MGTLDAIRKRILELYNTNPHIRINVVLTKPKINLNNTQVTIKGVYPHIFQIEEYTTGSPKSHTLQYNDILTGHIQIIDEVWLMFLCYWNETKLTKKFKFLLKNFKYFVKILLSMSIKNV